MKVNQVGELPLPSIYLEGMNKTKVLYVEDELYLGKIVKESLESRDFEVQMLEDGKEVVQEFKSFGPDICVFDVMLPFKDGFTIGKEIREIDSTVPIIYLTAKNQTQDVVKGFESGGNDYLKKPFSVEELIIRMKNLLHLTVDKKPKAPKPEILPIGGYEFDARKMTLSWGKEQKRLSHRETQLLTILYQHRGQPIDRRKILNDIWGDDHFFNSRNLDVYIRKLRAYLDKDSDVHLITLKGVGYQFVVGG